MRLFAFLFFCLFIRILLFALFRIFFRVFLGFALCRFIFFSPVRVFLRFVLIRVFLFPAWDECVCESERYALLGVKECFRIHHVRQFFM